MPRNKILKTLKNLPPFIERDGLNYWLAVVFLTGEARAGYYPVTGAGLINATAPLMQVVLSSLERRGIAEMGEMALALKNAEGLRPPPRDRFHFEVGKQTSITPAPLFSAEGVSVTGPIPAGTKRAAPRPPATRKK